MSGAETKAVPVFGEQRCVTTSRIDGDSIRAGWHALLPMGSPVGLPENLPLSA